MPQSPSPSVVFPSWPVGGAPRVTDQRTPGDPGQSRGRSCEWAGGREAVRRHALPRTARRSPEFKCTLGRGCRRRKDPSCPSSFATRAPPSAARRELGGPAWPGSRGGAFGCGGQLSPSFLLPAAWNVHEKAEAPAAVFGCEETFRWRPRQHKRRGVQLSCDFVELS